jgi:hypothetical protein
MAARTSTTCLPRRGYATLEFRIDQSCANVTFQLNLLRTLVMWSLSSSDEISTKIRDSYKQTRHAEDENQPLSVQPWGRDCDKRRYFLIEGQDDTFFRVYRENHRYTRNAQWYNMAGNIDEIRALAEKLEKEDGSQAARTLSARMTQAIIRFEGGEEVWLSRRTEFLATINANMSNRNAVAASTAKLDEHNSLAPSPDFQCTKAAPVASACGTHTTMGKTRTRTTTRTSPMQLRIAARLANPVVAHLLKSVPSTPPAAVR